MTQQLASSSPSNAIPVMPSRPRKGEIWLALNLSEIESHTPWEALKVAEGMGFTPELRYQLHEDKVQLFAVLFYEKREYESALEEDFLDDECLQLANTIQPASAIQMFYCLKYGRQGTSAA